MSGDQNNFSRRVQEKKHPQVDLLNAPILPALLKVSYPILIAMFSLTVFNIVDTFFVSRLGSEALSAMGFTFPIFILLIAVGAGLTIGVSSLVARCIGAGEDNFAAESAKHGVIMALLLGLVVTLVGYFAGPAVISFMGASGAAAKMAINYVHILLLASTAKYLLHVFEGTLRGEGLTRVSMRMLLISSVSNIVLDPLFIFGPWFFPRMEIEGAALATALAWLIGCLYALDYYRRGKGIFNLNFRGFSFQYRYVRDTIAVGFPASLTQGFLSISLFVFNRILMLLPQGESLVAAFGVGFRLEALVILPLVGLSAGTVVMIGQNYGALKLDRVKEIIAQGRNFIILAMGGVGIAIILAAPYLMKAFSTDPEVLKFGVHYLRIAAPGYAFLGMGMLANAAFQGMGKGKPALVNVLIRFMGVQLTCAYVFAIVMGWGPIGAWAAVLVANVTFGIVSAGWVQRSIRNQKTEQENKSILVEEAR